MDPLDGFYQELDSEQFLKRHGPELRADAREVLAANPDARVAGLITLPDSSEAGAMRRMLAAGTGQDFPPDRLLLGIVPRSVVEALLTARCNDFDWREEPSAPQRLLPVVVSTKDGFRFGFFSLQECGDEASGHA